MAVPKKKTSKSRRDMRRSHDALTRVTSVGCANCGAPRLPHHVCPSCGWYKNQQIVVKKEKSEEFSED
ncbi:MAG: 50S ribosomal protein L32 [Holosporales bacterium]|nr:50S ribosomal protein L32 [Holosporales bacterium]